MERVVRMVDLFSGCGGLSLGFECNSGGIRYESAMALDNASRAVRCYNANRPRPSSKLPTARQVDMTWFAHPSEALLYYLSHLSLWQPSRQLSEELNDSQVGFNEYLSKLKAIDENFHREITTLTNSASFKGALGSLDHRTLKLAMVASFLSRLGLRGLEIGRANTGYTDQLWTEEYELHATRAVANGADEVLPFVKDDVTATWSRELDALYQASRKVGRGQQAVVADRITGLHEFLIGQEGQRLSGAWISWRSARDSVRATFCIEKYERLRELYTDERRVHLILGGPPCKGFSRIGRAVIEDLRNQGAHAWTSHEYGDERNALLHKYVLFLDALRPDAFLFENVAHFQSGLRTPAGRLDATEVLTESIEALSESGLHYEVSSDIVKAKRHAVPQDRSRFIMIGFNSSTTPSAFLASSFFRLEEYERDVPLRLALQGLGAPHEFGSHTGTTNVGTRDIVDAYHIGTENLPSEQRRYFEWVRQPGPHDSSAPIHVDSHVVRQLRNDDIDLLRRFGPGMRWMDYQLKHSETADQIQGVLRELLDYIDHAPSPQLPSADRVRALLDRVDSSLLLRLMIEDTVSNRDQAEGHHLLGDGYLAKGTDAHGDWFERLSPSRPSKTVVAHIGKDTYGYFHPWENRALSMREAARIQSFPDFFSFGTAGIVDGYSLIGDAVPPLLANTFARRMEALDQALGIFAWDGRLPTDPAPARRGRQLRMESEPSR